MIKLKKILTEATHAEFEQTKLKHDFKAYEPAYDKETMKIHYTKHYAGYTKKLNEAIKEENIPVVMGNDMEGIKNILASVTTYSSKLRNNAGGFFNHTLFFNGLNPEDKGRTTDGKLEDMIKEQYNSIDEFKSKFVEAGMNHFGDGWLWLMFDKGQLTIASTDKQDNPYMDDIAIPGRIILAVDLWEHSYYLKYKNEREKYLNAFFKLVCWESANTRLKRAEKALLY